MEHLNLAGDVIGAVLGSAFVQTLIGGLISAKAAAWAVDRQLDADRDNRVEGDKAQMQSLKSAIRLELNTIREIHMDGVGAEIEECRENPDLFSSHYPIYSDYFTLFSGNAGTIGRAPAHVAEAVVQAYIHLKALVDTFRFNNSMLERLENLMLRGTTEGGDEIADLREQLVA